MKKTAIILSFIILLSGCTSRKFSVCIKNCTNDTLFIELNMSDKIEDMGLCCGYDLNKDQVFVFPNDSLIALYPDLILSVCNIRGKKQILLKENCILPDSSYYVPIDVFGPRGTCYMYVIKWSYVKKYTFEEIRKRKLYYRRAVKYADFRKNNWTLTYPPQQADKDK